MPNTKETQGYHGLAFCGDESMIPNTFLHNEKRRPRPVAPFLKKGEAPGRAPLRASYITHQPDGSIRASGGRHSLTDIAGYFPPRPRETRPVVATPGSETNPARGGW